MVSNESIYHYRIKKFKIEEVAAVARYLKEIYPKNGIALIMQNSAVEAGGKKKRFVETPNLFIIRLMESYKQKGLTKELSSLVCSWYKKS
jgi:hypothetical protein